MGTVLSSTAQVKSSQLFEVSSWNCSAVNTRIVVQVLLMVRRASRYYVVAIPRSAKNKRSTRHSRYSNDA